jgi:hypothetical protein
LLLSSLLPAVAAAVRALRRAACALAVELSASEINFFIFASASRKSVAPSTTTSPDKRHTHKRARAHRAKIGFLHRAERLGVRASGQRADISRVKRASI